MSDEPIRQESFLIPAPRTHRWREKFHHLIWRIIGPLSDRPYIRIKYRVIMGRWPDIDKPRRFSEKVQYRKLYDRNPLYATLVDKAAVKAYADAKLGSACSIPTYWTGTDLSAVDWSQVRLPAVVKPTHASAKGRFLYSQADIDALIAENPVPGWLKLDHARFNREWAYSQVQPRVIIEKMLGVDGGVPWDYRFFTFGGRVFCVQVDMRVDGKGYCCFYDRNWMRMPVLGADYLPAWPAELPRPARFDDMLDMAERLGDGLDFVRVDLYAADDWVRLGELTLYPDGGFENYRPAEFDLRLGDQWTQKAGF